MNEKILSKSLSNFRLNITPDWFVAADELQWILCRTVCDSPKPKVQAQRFIGSNKRSLAIAAAECGLLNREDFLVQALAFLSDPPFKFNDWVLLHTGNPEETEERQNV